MEKQIFTQEQAHEMFESICHFNDDFENISDEVLKKSPIIKMAYISGFRQLEEKIDKELKTQKR